MVAAPNGGAPGAEAGALGTTHDERAESSTPPPDCALCRANLAAGNGHHPELCAGCASDVESSEAADLLGYVAAQPDHEPGTRTSGPVALSVPVDEFLAKDFPETKELIPGMIALGAHTLVSSPRGLGKSNFANTLAVSLSSGACTMPGFEVTEPAKVLYIDGEMQPRLVQDRTRMHAAMTDSDPEDLREDLRVISRVALQAEHGYRLPSLATPEGREWLIREIEVFGHQVVFVDTVRALMRHPEHSLNDEEGWRPVEELLAELSALNVSMVYLHHDGKGGDQLGTSAREFDPSYVLKMERPKRTGLGWCRFRLTETKGRMGPSFLAREYVLEPAYMGDGSVWSLVEEEAITKAERILQYHGRNPGATSAAIAETVGTTDSHVRSVLSKARRGAP